MNRHQALNGGYICMWTGEPDLDCETCARQLSAGHFRDTVAPIHYDRNHATPGAHFRVFGCYDTAAYPNPYEGASRWSDYQAYCAALDELSTEEVAERLGWRSRW